MYCCPVECPGRIPQPHHIPGYSGHIPTKRERNGSTFGRMSRDVIEDPCVAQAPCPILTPPASNCCPCPDDCLRNPVGCEDIGCCEPVCCPPPRPFHKPKKPPCPELCCDPCMLMKCFPGQVKECCQPGCCPPKCCPPKGPCCPKPENCCAPCCRPPACKGSGLCCPPSCCGPAPSCPPKGGSGAGGRCGGGGGAGGSSGGCGPQPKDPCCSADCCGLADCCPELPSCPPKKKGPDTCFEKPQEYYACGPCPPPGCTEYMARAHHINRGPYACPCKPEPDCQIYRCCEPMSSSYAGHVPGFTFHSTSRTIGKATFGTKQYMNKCLYFNTWTKP